MQNNQNGGSFSVEPSCIGSLVELQAAALEATANAVVITDPTGTVIWVNAAFELLTGYGRAEILGQSTRILKSGKNSPALYVEMWRTIIDGKAWRGELINRRKDGSLYEEEMTITPARNHAGKITHYIAVKLDISGRKRAEERIQLLAKAVERSPNLISLAGIDGRLQYVNLALRETLQFSQEELDGQPFIAILSKNNSPDLLQEITAKTFEPGGWEGECLVPRKDGTDAPVLLSSNSIRDEHGTVIGAIGIAQDITERTQAEEQLRRREYFLFESQRLGHIGSWFYDLTEPLAWSPEMYRLYGVSPETFVPTIEAFLGLIHPEDRPVMQAWIAACAAGDQPGDCEFRIKMADGTFRFMVGGGEAVHDAENRLLHMAGTVVDITQRKQFEELRKTHESELIEAQRIAGLGSFLWTLATGTLGWSEGLKFILRRDLDLPTPTFDALSCFYTPEGWERLMAAAARVIETGAPDEIEVEMIRDDGTTCWTTLRGEPRLGPDGSVMAIQGIVQDIDKRKRAELTAQQEKDFSRGIIEGLPGLFCLISEHGQILRWNKGLSVATGYSAEEISRMSALDFFKEPDKSLMAERMHQAFSQGAAIAEASFTAKDQTETPYLFSALRLTIEGNPCLAALGHDITKRKQVESQRERLAILVEASPDFIGFADPKTAQIQYINKHGRRMCGIGEDEDISKLKISDVHPAWMNKFLTEVVLPGAVRDGLWEGEGAFLHRNGREIPVLMALMARKAPSGEVDIFYTVSRDITERRRAEKLLQDSEIKHRVLFDESADANLLMDEKGFVDCNSAALQMFRYPTKAELITLSSAEISPPNQPDGTPSRTAANQKIADTVLNGKNRFEWLHRRKGGEVFPAEVCLTTLTLSGQTMLLATVRDMTERVKSEERLQLVVPGS